MTSICLRSHNDRKSTELGGQITTEFVQFEEVHVLLEFHDYDLYKLLNIAATDSTVMTMMK